MDGARLQGGAEGFGELVEATGDLGKAAGVTGGQRVSVGSLGPLAELLTAFLDWKAGKLASCSLCRRLHIRLLTSLCARGITVEFYTLEN